MSKIVLWRNADGTVRIQSFSERACLQLKITEGELITRETDKLKRTNPSFAKCDMFIKDRAEVDGLLKAGGSHVDNLKINKDGSLYLDASVELQDTKTANKKEGVKTKLMSGQPLSEEEANFLLGGR